MSCKRRLDSWNGAVCSLFLAGVSYLGSHGGVLSHGLHAGLLHLLRRHGPHRRAQGEMNIEESQKEAVLAIFSAH